MIETLYSEFNDFLQKEVESLTETKKKAEKSLDEAIMIESQKRVKNIMEIKSKFKNEEIIPLVNRKQNESMLINHGIFLVFLEDLLEKKQRKRELSKNPYEQFAFEGMKKDIVKIINKYRSIFYK